MSNSTLGSALKRVPEIASLSVVLIASLVLAGWATDSLVLRSVVPRLPPMRPIAAVGLILGSASLWLLAANRLNQALRRLGAVCALLVALLGCVTIIEHLFGVNPGVDGDVQGATFVVKLPLMASYITEVGAERAYPGAAPNRLTFECPPQLKGLRVLVVEDEADARDLVSGILAECEAEVKTAASTSEALTILGKGAQCRPDVVISDIEMADSDGYDLIRRLRTLAAEGGDSVPAGALMADARVEDRMKALAAAFQMHVPKPVEPEELVTRSEV